MKLLAIVVTYNPDKELLKVSVLKYISFVEELIIWENSNIYDREKYRIDLGEYNSKIRYIGGNDNVFIAYALNYAIEYAREHGFTHLLTMDQDSLFESNSFGRFKLLVENRESENAIFAPKILSTKGKDVYSLSKECVTMFSNVSNVITSGSIFKLSLFLKTGLFREDYKIDYVDFEFCLRARMSGYKIYVANEIILYQEYGNIKKILNWYILNYSPSRLYYQTRNRIILKKEYPNLYNSGRSWNVNIKLMVKILLFENNKIKKVVSIIRGVFDGLCFKSPLVNYKYYVKNRE